MHFSFLDGVHPAIILSARVGVFFMGLVCLPYASQGQVNYAYSERSNPAGLIPPFTEEVPSSTERRVRDYAVISGNYRFAFWTFNGVRQSYPSGQAYMNPTVTVTEPVDAVANFFPVTEDGDGDRLQDWWEYWMFGDRSRGPQDDDDGDGLANEKEYLYGLSARFRDDVNAGGISARLSPPLRMILRNRLRYTLRSEPLGLVSAEGELTPGESYTTPYLFGDSSGYTFVGFEVNGQVMRDSTGFSLSRITITPASDAVVVARYVPTGSDSDADGIPDAYELQNFGTLTNGPASDPDGDGITIAEERRLGLSLVTADRIRDGGIAARLSAPLEYDVIRTPYTVQSRPLGLINGTSEKVLNGTERTTPAIEAGLVSGYAFGYWTLNGQRVAGPDGIARRQVKLAVNGPSELVAHFFLPDQDADADGLPDWWEWNLFGSVSSSGQSDPDGDGIPIDYERSRGLAVANRDILKDGGIAARLSAPLQYESGSRKLITIRSSPRGIVTEEEQRLAANAEFTSNHYDFSGNYSGYYFTHWTSNGVRVTDGLGHSRNRLVFDLTEDTELVAHFALPAEDVDADGIPDHVEMRLASSLSALGPDSDPEGDGLSMGTERRMGLSPLSRDVILDGGIAARLSAPAVLQFQVPPLTLKPDSLHIANGSLSGALVGELTLSPSISGRSYQFALDLGSGGDHNDRFTISGNELRLASALSVSEQILWIRIRATDDLGAVRTWQTTVTVSAAGDMDGQTSFTYWISQWPNLVSSPPEADPDGDGVSNLIEFVLGTDPTNSSSATYPAINLLNGNLTFTFRRSAVSKIADLALSVEAGEDLLSWPLRYNVSPGTPSSGVQIQDNGAEADTIIVTVPGPVNRRFVRLRADLAP